jgi:fimbrial chaperone protein
MLMRVLIQATCGLYFLMIGVTVLNAGSIGVSPIRVTLSTSQKVTGITVSNPGTQPMSIQLELMNWSQQEGKDVFTLTREVLANPPIFTIPPGESQLIRVGLRRAPDDQLELSYRLFLQELPPPLIDEIQGAQMLMRVSLPVFILPKAKTKPVLHWEASRTMGGALKLNLTNNGNAHIQIKSFKLSLLGKVEPLVTYKSPMYILPGQSSEIIISANLENPAPPLGAVLQLIAQTDAGVIEAEVMIAP